MEIGKKGKRRWEIKSMKPKKKYLSCIEKGKKYEEKKRTLDFFPLYRTGKKIEKIFKEGKEDESQKR